MNITAAKKEIIDGKDVIYEIRFVVGPDNPQPQYGRINLEPINPADPAFIDPVSRAQAAEWVEERVDTDALLTASLVEKVSNLYVFSD